MKGVDEQTALEQDSEDLPRRLCSEIQLFDLCELIRCSFKEGRFCTHADLLARFEALAEPDDRPARQYDDDEEDDEEALYPDELDDDDDDDDEGYSVFDEEDSAEGRPEDEW